MIRRIFFLFALALSWTTLPVYADTDSHTITIGVREMADVIFCEDLKEAEKIARAYQEQGLVEAKEVYNKAECYVTRTYARAIAVVSSWKRGTETMRILQAEIAISPKLVYVITLLPIAGMREV